MLCSLKVLYIRILVYCLQLVTYFLVYILSDDLAWQLWDASHDGDVSLVKDLLGQGANPNESYFGRECGGFTPLHWACQNNNAALAAALVDKGADVSATDYSGWTPLHYSCIKGNKPSTDVLLGTGKCQTG